MSQSGSQAAAFFREARQSGVVWFVRDDEGSPTPPPRTAREVFPTGRPQPAPRGRRRSGGTGYVLSPCPWTPGAIAICPMPPERDT